MASITIDNDDLDGSDVLAAIGDLSLPEGLDSSGTEATDKKSDSSQAPAPTEPTTEAPPRPARPSKLGPISRPSGGASDTGVDSSASSSASSSDSGPANPLFPKQTFMPFSSSEDSSSSSDAQPSNPLFPQPATSPSSSDSVTATTDTPSTEDKKNSDDLIVGDIDDDINAILGGSSSSSSSPTTLAPIQSSSSSSSSSSSLPSDSSTSVPSFLPSSSASPSSAKEHTPNDGTPPDDDDTTLSNNNDNSNNNNDNNRTNATESKRVDDINNNNNNSNTEPGAPSDSFSSSSSSSSSLSSSSFIPTSNQGEREGEQQGEGEKGEGSENKSDNNDHPSVPSSWTAVDDDNSPDEGVKDESNPMEIQPIEKKESKYGPGNAGSSNTSTLVHDTPSATGYNTAAPVNMNNTDNIDDNGNTNTQAADGTVQQQPDAQAQTGVINNDNNDDSNNNQDGSQDDNQDDNQDEDQDDNQGEETKTVPAGHHRRKNTAERLNLPREEIDVLREQFDRFDKDQDNTLTRDEILALLRAIGYAYTPAYVTSLLLKTFEDKGRYQSLIFEDFCFFWRVFKYYDVRVVEEIEDIFSDIFMGGVIETEDVNALLHFVEWKDEQPGFQEVERYLRQLYFMNQEHGAPQDGDLDKLDTNYKYPEVQGGVGGGGEGGGIVHHSQHRHGDLSLSGEKLAKAVQEEIAHPSATSTARSNRSDYDHDGFPDQVKDGLTEQQRIQRFEQHVRQQHQQQQREQQQQQQQHVASGQTGADQANTNNNNNNNNNHHDNNNNNSNNNNNNNNNNNKTGPRAPSYDPPPTVERVNPSQDRDLKQFGFMDQTDDDYLKQAFEAILSKYDVEGTNQISKQVLGSAFRAVGFDPSPQKLQELFNAADSDNSGLINFNEFRRFYNELYKEELRSKSMQALATELKGVFQRFDENGDGTVTCDEFRHAVQEMCGQGVITDHDLECVIKIMDADHDGTISFQEFLDACRMFLAYGHGAPENTNEEAFAYAMKGTEILMRKLLRWDKPSPLEHLLAFSKMPSNFRPSLLSTLNHSEDYFLSSYLNPVLDHTALVYDQFKLDSKNNKLMPVPPPVEFQQGKCVFPPTASFKEEIAVQYEIALNLAQYVPIPDVKEREWILSRRIRLCLFDQDGRNSVSNLHMAQADWNSKEEDIWRFKEKDANNATFIVKTDQNQSNLLFELCVLVERPRVQGNKVKRSNLKYDDMTASDAKSKFIEMTCGFALLELNNAGTHAGTHELQIFGGTIFSKHTIRPEDIRANREGLLHKIKSAVSSNDTKVSTLQVQCRTIPSNIAESVAVLPYNVIVPSKCATICHMFLKLLANSILQPTLQPFKRGHMCEPELMNFLVISDQLDLFQALAQMFELKSKENRTLMERMGWTQVAEQKLLDIFSSCVMEISVLTQVSHHCMPVYLPGVTDTKRQQMISLVSQNSNSLLTLFSDGMRAPGNRGDDGYSAPHAQRDVLGDSLCYKPFNTRELAYDHSINSEKDHANQRMAHHFNHLIQF